MDVLRHWLLLVDVCVFVSIYIHIRIWPALLRRHCYAMESQTCIILNFAAGIKILIDMLDLGHPGAKLHVCNPLLGHGHTRSHEGTFTA
jgi:hypothetical protein